MAKKIPIASDHAGYELKEELVRYLKELGYEPEDLGTHGAESVDYPDYAGKVARLISSGERKQGVLVCGTGIGMSIAANKYPRVRAALATDELTATLAREHNDSNIITLGGRTLKVEQARAILKKWLETDFLGGRHARRVEQISEIEAGEGRKS
ncbi:MAG: ribose 5-phosphate isomerase B [Candidatus Glassbacteria bacterium RIFCSPLOWO2_12_FULL_58_11]|uniref:Ribose 5-phosphate isomerase B n=1 Tax=Candidatus Glassbacteria bacterium RIFCSPLOWO2_12_FULL_58_11 TaxID=1817867 RepID=A0A1F5YNQ5_9BACT|nr:MAG: ribose 5-phosphate isomerase B [Candidatus Glassbacteria bacterium RIFCSPLOWO2_12_FULL_58_11]